MARSSLTCTKYCLSVLLAERILPHDSAVCVLTSSCWLPGSFKGTGLDVANSSLACTQLLKSKLCCFGKEARISKLSEHRRAPRSPPAGCLAASGVSGLDVSSSLLTCIKVCCACQRQSQSKECLRTEVSAP